MKYGTQFEKVFKEAMKSPDFWLEDIQLSFLDSLLDPWQIPSLCQQDT